MPNTIADNLARLQQAKSDIANAIITKGGTVNSGDGLEDFATDIGTIPSGGGFQPITVNIEEQSSLYCKSVTIDEAMCDGTWLTIQFRVVSGQVYYNASSFFYVQFTFDDIETTSPYLSRLTRGYSNYTISSSEATGSVTGLYHPGNYAVTDGTTYVCRAFAKSKAKLIPTS